jgi:hypothetical protein
MMLYVVLIETFICNYKMTENVLNQGPETKKTCPFFPSYFHLSKESIRLLKTDQTGTFSYQYCTGSVVPA